MILPISSDGFDDYIDSIRIVVENSLFDFLPELYEDHSDIVRSIFSYRNQWTCDGYIGEEYDMVISGIKYDVSDILDWDKFWDYVTDYIARLKNRILEDCSTDYEYLRSLSRLYSDISSVDCDLLYDKLLDRYKRLRLDSGSNGNLIIPSELEYLLVEIFTGTLLSEQD